MWNISRQSFGFLLTFGGRISLSEMQAWLDEINKKLGEPLPKSWGVVVDMQSLEPLDQPTLNLMLEGQKVLRAKGMRRSAVALKDAVATMQFRRLVRGQGSEAWERYINVAKTPNWQSEAKQWVISGREPADPYVRNLLSSAEMQGPGGDLPPQDKSLPTASLHPDPQREVEPEIDQETQARIIAAANQLYEQNGRIKLPTIDAVCRQTKVSNETASAVMKEWLRMQSATSTPAGESIPGRLRQDFEIALTSVWAQALDSAKKSLKAQHATLEGELVQSKKTFAELSSAFEQQAEELAESRTLYAELNSIFEKLAEELEERNARLAELEHDAEEAASRAAETARKFADTINAKRGVENRAANTDPKGVEKERRNIEYKMPIGKRAPSR